MRAYRVLCCLLLAMQARAQDPAVAAAAKADPAQISAGKAQFGQKCGFCHGANGRGASGPDLIHSGLVSHDVKGNLIGEVVRNGRPEKGMPAFQLSDQQIQAIAAFLHNEASLAYSVYARGPGDYAVEKLLVGNAQAGKKYFDGAGRCTKCHSTSGDFAHLASKYKPVELQSRIAFPAGPKSTVTVTDPSGKRWSGPEVYSDEWVVSLRDTTNSVHTFDRKTAHVDIKDPMAAHEEILFQLTDKQMHDLFAYLVTLK